MFLSPVVRKLAREHNLDLSSITGTGRDGRITRRDVEALIESGAARTAAPAEPPAAAAPAAPAPPAVQPAASQTAAAAPADIPLLEGDEVRDLDRLRVRIGENMIQAKQTAAHVWTSVEV
ncbi:MAG: 2-oxo acid dehydrogenase subunit E2, partial [Actinobacteria bacterium]|nr:2-oxo acid dehydrogenase subunit E2 [Actinomycetota bacterium]